jgi:hypothetical protein
MTHRKLIRDIRAFINRGKRLLVALERHDVLEGTCDTPRSLTSETKLFN